METLRLASLSQQSEAQRLTSCLSSVQHETRELQEELERRNNNIKAKVRLKCHFVSFLFVSLHICISLKKDDKLQKLVHQMQQHDKAQLESKQNLTEIKKKLLDSQTEIVKLHCKLQESVSSAKTSQSEIEHLRRCNEQMQGKGMKECINHIVEKMLIQF